MIRNPRRPRLFPNYASGFSPMISPVAVGDNAQVVTAPGLLFSLSMAGLLVVLPRRYAMLPILALVCYMTMGERVVIGGVNFTMVRILLLFGWLRLLARGESGQLRWHTVDKVIIAWAIFRTINYTLVWGTTAALINRLGYAYDIVGAYFLFRFLIRDEQDIYRAIRYLAIFVVPVAILIVIEKATARNVFALLGGVPLIPELRDGVVRCQGPFAHSILAGTFGATTVPLFIGMWMFQRSGRMLAVAGLLASTTIVLMGGSSGPVLAYGAGVAGICAWIIRTRLHLVRWGLCVVLLVLHVFMNSPVWFIIARASVFSGSTGWYRGYLIDMSVRHLDEWWLIGTSRAHQWHYYLADVTNQYLVEGLSGGLITMSLFIALIALSFRSIGLCVRQPERQPESRYFVWTMGAALLSHSISFISVSYFDQNAIVFYFLLASITTLSVAQTRVARLQRPVRRTQPAAIFPIFAS